MLRAKWTTILAAALSCCGPALAQNPLPPTNVPRVVTIQEEGKPAMQCRVLKTWKSGNAIAFEVESLTTGERITLVESGPLNRYAGGGKVVQEVRSRIYHWVHNTPPADAPLAPPDAIVSATPSSPVQTATHPAAMPSAAPSSKVTTAANIQPAPALATVTPVARTADAPTPPAAPAFPPAAAPSVLPAPGTANVAPAQSSDWRQSWGKANDHKSEVPVADTPVAERAPSHMPARDELPQASKETKDPLADPEVFSPYHLKNKDGAMNVLEVKPGEGVNAKIDDKSDSSEEATAEDSAKKSEASVADKKDASADEAKKSDADKETVKAADKKDSMPASKTAAKPSATFGERVKGFFARKETDKPKVEPAKEEDPSSMGLRSVYAACEAAGMPPPAPGAMPPAAPPLPVVTITDTDPSNAFTTIVRRPKAKKVASEQANAFDGQGRQAPSMPPYQVPQGMPPMPPQGYAGVPPTPPGVAPMQPAVPQTYGYAPARPAGVVPVAYANGNPATRPTMDGGLSGATTPGHASASSNPDAPQLLLVLRSSLFPSNREWAADQLSHVEWHSNPVVVEMLLQSAKNDPAPSVREACVRNLGKMNANTPSVVDGLTALQKDENDSVRKEVTRTLSKFQTATGSTVRSPIQPASAR